MINQDLNAPFKIHHSSEATTPGGEWFLGVRGGITALDALIGVMGRGVVRFPVYLVSAFIE